MKKTIWIAVGVVGVLGVIGFLLIKSALGPLDAAALAPEDSVVFVNFNNLARTALRWKGTALAKIAAEPDLIAFIEKPLAHLQKGSGMETSASLLSGLKPTTVFLAVVHASPTKPDALVGVQYWGSRKEFDLAVARLRKQLPPASGTGTKSMRDGVEFTATQHGALHLVTAARGTWGFVGTSEAVVQGAIGRLLHGDRGLPSNTQFPAVRSHLASDPDVLFFLQTGSTIDALLHAGRSMGAEPIPSQVAALRKVEALGISLKFDGDLQRESIFALRPGTPPTSQLNRKPLDLTSGDTAIYLDFLGHFGGLVALTDKLKDAVPQNAQNRDALEAANEAGRLVRLASDAFGPECGLVVNWGQDATLPSPMLAIEVRQTDKAHEFLDALMKHIPDVQTNAANGRQVFTFPSASVPMVTPALALSDRFLLLGTSPDAVSAAAQLHGRPPNSLDRSPDFSAAAPIYSEAGDVFAFVDTRKIFERAYTTARPAIIFAAAVIPGMTEWIDPAKLPPAESVGRHLAPIVFSGRRLSDGILLESSGPITMGQAVLALGVGSVYARTSSLFNGNMGH